MNKHIFFAFQVSFTFLLVAGSQFTSAAGADPAGTGNVTGPATMPTTTQPSLNVALDAELIKHIHAKDAIGTRERLLKRLPQGSFEREDVSNPDKIAYGANSQLRWVELSGSDGAGGCQCILFFFTPDAHFISLQDVGQCRLQKEPEIISDSKHLLYMITGQERGTEVCCTWVQICRAPIHDADSKEWLLPKSLFQGRSNGYVGEWMTSELMKLIFPKTYKRSDGGDGQLLNFAIDYKLSGSADAPITLHRTGSVSLSGFNERENAKAIVNERYIYL